MPQHEEFDVLVEDVRLISRICPSICWKIRYNGRSVTAAIVPNLWRPPITAGQQRVLRSGTQHAPAVKTDD
jgi:hypothetical protein